jgi:hypothetical protein
MCSVFDIMGWVFTVANSPTPANATDANFYYPLTALYAKFCRMFSTTTSPTGEVYKQPTVIAMAKFVDPAPGGRWSVIIGATLDNPPRGSNPPQPSFKDTLQEDRRQALIQSGLIHANEYRHPPNFLANPAPLNTQQRFGHCAETWFFWVVQS